MIADVLVMAGLVLLTVAVYGVLRLPDVYTQLHAASKAALPGVALLLASAALRGDGAVAARAALTVALLTVTTPVAAHAIARAAHRREVKSGRERPGGRAEGSGGEERP